MSQRVQNHRFTTKVSYGDRSQSWCRNSGDSTGIIKGGLHYNLTAGRISHHLPFGANNKKLLLRGEETRDEEYMFVLSKSNPIVQYDLIAGWGSRNGSYGTAGLVWLDYPMFKFRLPGLLRIQYLEVGLKILSRAVAQKTTHTNAFLSEKIPPFLPDRRTSSRTHCYGLGPMKLTSLEVDLVPLYRGRALD